MASSRRRPVASVSESRTLYATRNVLPVSGVGTRASTRETLRQLEHHSVIVLVRGERDVAEAFVQVTRRVVVIDAQRDAVDTVGPRPRVDRFHQSGADALPALPVHDGDD